MKVYFLIGLLCVTGLLPALQADEKVKNEDGTTTLILDEKPQEPEYDPYKRAPGDSARDARLRKKDAEKLFPEEMKREAEEKAIRDARPSEVKKKEADLIDRTPVLQEKISPTIKNRACIPKRF